jgi:hypothetical protein
MGVGLGALLVTVTAAANAGVPADKAGLAAGLLNTSQQLGTALAIAVFSALATARTNDLLATGTAIPDALTEGFGRAVLAGSVFVAVAAVIGLLAPHTHTVSTTPGIPADGEAARTPPDTTNPPIGSLKGSTS